MNSYKERRYFCGNYLEINIFPVFPVPGSRGKKKKPTSEVQQRLNDHNAEQKLIRILNANFTSSDIEIHLTFSDENLPGNDEEAARIIQNYLRRVKRARKKRGLDDLKYVCVTEGGSEGKRYHYHVTMNGGLERDTLEKLWGFGYANSRRLQFNKNGVEGLARYITKQFRTKKRADAIFKKKWTASKNLVIPEAKDRECRISEKRLKQISVGIINPCAIFEKIYSDYEMASCVPFHNDVNQGIYLCVKMYKKNTVFENNKKRIITSKMLE